MMTQEHVVQIEVQQGSADGRYYLIAFCTCGHYFAKFPRGIEAGVLYESIGEHERIHARPHSAHAPKPARTALDMAKDTVADALRDRADMLVSESMRTNMTEIGRTPVLLRILAHEMRWLAVQLCPDSTAEDIRDVLP